MIGEIVCLVGNVPVCVCVSVCLMRRIGMQPQLFVLKNQGGKWTCKSLRLSLQTVHVIHVWKRMAMWQAELHY